MSISRILTVAIMSGAREYVSSAESALLREWCMRVVHKSGAGEWCTRLREWCTRVREWCTRKTSVDWAWVLQGKL